MTTARELETLIRRLGDPEIARTSAWFFKTGPGEYAAGDRFVGVRVPVLRRLARQHRDLPRSAATRLLRSPIHEVRLTALLILAAQTQRGGTEDRRQIYDLYLANVRHVNNWDLVDSSAPQIVGTHLADRSRAPLDRLARSANVWERRIAIIATLHFIRGGELDDTLRLAKRLLTDEHDLIHKATGWMLREVGKRDRARLTAFLQQHAANMPRTMLRYALEHYPESQRRRYMALPAARRSAR